MKTTVAETSHEHASALRRLYVIRFGFAIIWAALLIVTGRQFGPLTAALVVLYPLFDVAAAVIDARSSRSTPSRRGLALNIAISTLAAIGLGIAATSGSPAVLRVWGVWAIVAGLIQLALGINRRTMGGHWPMMLSGAISALAGAAFIVMAGSPNPSIANLAGYAVLGGIFFLASALRLRRATEEH